MNAITLPIQPLPAKVTIETDDNVWTFVAPHGVGVDAEWTCHGGANYTLDFYASETEVVEAVQQPVLFDLVEADCE